MKLQKDYYLNQLFTLKPTEEDMKALAIYTRTFSDDSDIISDVFSYTHAQSSIHHRLTLYYLINEILVAEKSLQSLLRLTLKSFVKRHFQSDMLLAIKFEVVYRKFTELENIWKAKQTIDFEEKYMIEEIVSRIREVFHDKGALYAFLRELEEYYEPYSK